MTACDPRGSEVVVKLADPAVMAEVPSLAVPAEKVMFPVGTPSPAVGLTVAVKTVVPPNTGAAGLTERVVELEISDGCADFEKGVPDPQPVTNISPLSMNTQSETRKYFLRRFGTMSSSSPARLKARGVLDGLFLELGTAGAEEAFAVAASCTVSVEVRTPLLPTVLGLKLQVNPAVPGQERTMLFGESVVAPLGVIVTVKAPLPFERDKDD